MSRSKILVSGKIGNSEISTVKTVNNEVVTEEYILDGFKNPGKWGLSKILKGWIVEETYDKKTDKWEPTESINFEDFLNKKITAKNK